MAYVVSYVLPSMSEYYVDDDKAKDALRFPGYDPVVHEYSDRMWCHRNELYKKGGPPRRYGEHTWRHKTTLTEMAEFAEKNTELLRQNAYIREGVAMFYRRHCVKLALGATCMDQKATSKDGDQSSIDSNKEIVEGHPLPEVATVATPEYNLCHHFDHFFN